MRVRDCGELLFLVLGGGHAGEVLEVFAERALVGEIEFVGHLLYVFAREAEEVLCFEDDHVVDPLACAAACGFFDYERKVFRGYEEFFGIERHRPFRAVVFLDKSHEFMEVERPPGAYGIGSIWRIFSRNALSTFHEVIDQCSHEVHDNLTAVV